MRHIIVDGATIAFDVGGSGPAILLIHGFTGAATSWAAQVPRWQASYRTIAVDLLGHGRSDAPRVDGRYAIARQADDMLAVLDAEDVDRAIVLGYSMGSRIALSMAADHGDRVDAIVLESPSAGIADPDERMRRRTADTRLAEHIERDGVATFVAEWEARPLFASHQALPSAARARLHEERTSQRAAGLAAALRGAGQGAMTPLHDRLPDIGCPSLVIGGALDVIGRERARIVADGLPNARLELIAAAGHTPHLEQPDAFDQLVLTYLSNRLAPRPH